MSPTPPPTPVRSTGTRTDEGWILLRDVGSSYRDGAEDALYQQVSAASDVSAESDLLISAAEGWAERYHVDPDRPNIVRGLAIAPGARVLEIGSGCGAVTRHLGEVAGSVDALEPVPARARVARARTRDLPGVEVFVGQVEDLPAEPTYDVVVVVGVMEYVGGGSAEAEPYVTFLRAIADRLVPGGTLALAIENKLGVKYQAGAPEDHTNRVFDSLEGYPHGTHARTFSRLELEALMTAAGLTPRTLGVFPDYKMTRVVLDPQVLGARDDDLVARLPVFPSPDHLTPRAHLADERALWQSFCAAGLAAEVPNSFLVLAGKGGPSDLWPTDRAAIYHSLGRRAGFRVTAEVREQDGRTVVERSPRTVAGVSGPLVPVHTVEDVQPGVDLVDWAAQAEPAALGAALGRWLALVDGSVAEHGGVSLDLVPHNLLVDPAGELRVIDQEWAPDSTAERVVARGLVWFAARLAMRSSPQRWAVRTVGELAVHLGRLAGRELGAAELEQVVADEALVQAEVLVRPAGVSQSELVEQRAADLRHVLATPLELTPFGPRSTDRLRDLETLIGRGDLVGRGELAAAQGAAQAAEQRLASVQGGTAWRALGLYYRGIEKVAPAGTRRRAVYGRSGRAAIRLAKQVRDLRRGLPAAVTGPIELPTSGQPVVSVVVPVHGQWAVTEQCLRSFVAHPPTVPFEIVVVDDASTDDTRARLAEVRGLRTVLLDVNQGFVGAVNAGIGVCTGEFVVLLNNDTQITPGWLEALVETAGQDGVGLVGSKLVYPDGRLQEAGGIIFENGGGWNYGRFDDPARERYCYPRDVDYCSGAAIMIRRDLLAEIGNLDEHFAPAYFDDVDLAFSVRERGLRVVYQPRAVVVHHEGVSHGTDESSGIKAYQAINREKFVAKWAHRLVDHYPQVEALVPAAARRLDGRSLVVVVDHHVPRPDEDAGSVRMFALLRGLKSLGHGVVFIPDDRQHGDVWGDQLLAEGIEVFCGPEHPEEFLATLHPRVGLVIGARVTVAWPYLVWTRRTLPGVPFVFDTVDLHHVRELREAELSGDEGSKTRARTTREMELAMVRSAEATLVVSPDEVALLAEQTPDATVLTLPTVHVAQAEPAGPVGRVGAVFVGSFGHPPNADGVGWFLREVLPLVRAQIPGFPVTVVGRGAPQDLVDQLPPGVDLRGWLPTLDDAYARARVAIAPLRYGAGIKGKVGEAMSYGVPVVLTPVAAEGMGLRHGETGWVAPDAEQFARGIVALATDDELWSAVSAAGREHVERTLGADAFTEQLRQVLAVVGRAPESP